MTKRKAMSWRTFKKYCYLTWRSDSKVQGTHWACGLNGGMDGGGACLPKNCPVWKSLPDAVVKEDR